MKDFISFIFLELLPKMIVVLLIIAVTLGALLGCAYVLWIGGAFNGVNIPSRQDMYEDSYRTCIARETLSDAQCHDIALKEAYPDD